MVTARKHRGSFRQEILQLLLELPALGPVAQADEDHVADGKLQEVAPGRLVEHDGDGLAARDCGEGMGEGAEGSDAPHRAREGEGAGISPWAVGECDDHVAIGEINGGMVALGMTHWLCSKRS